MNKKWICGEIFEMKDGRRCRTVLKAQSPKNGKTILVYQELSGECRILAEEEEQLMRRLERKAFEGETEDFCTEGEASTMRSEKRTSEGRREDACTEGETSLMRREKNASVEKSYGIGTPHDAETKEKLSGSMNREENPGENKEKKNSEETDMKDDSGQEINGENEGGGSLEETVNPLLMDFLDADSMEEKYNILLKAQNKMDGNFLSAAAFSIDCILPEGSFEEQLAALKYFLTTKRKYESSRFH